MKEKCRDARQRELESMRERFAGRQYKRVEMRPRPTDSQLLKFPPLPHKERVKR